MLYNWLDDDRWMERFGAFVAAYQDAVDRGAIKPLLSRDMETMGRAVMDGLAAGLAVEGER